MKKYDSNAEEYFTIPGKVDNENKGIKTYRDTNFFKKLLSKNEDCQE